MLALLAALLAPAHARAPDLSAFRSVEVAYKMVSTGTMSCETTYRGRGVDPVVQGDAVTFTGTWEVVQDTCRGATVWVPEDGQAFHTLRLDKKGKAFDEWIVHDKAEDTTRFTTNIKDRGQYWINELAAPASGGEIHYTAEETQGIGPLSITIAHDLTIRLHTDAPAEPAPEPSDAP